MINMPFPPYYVKDTRIKPDMPVLNTWQKSIVSVFHYKLAFSGFFFIVCLQRHALTMWLYLSYNSLYISGWPLSNRSLTSFASQVLVLQVISHTQLKPIFNVFSYDILEKKVIIGCSTYIQTSKAPST